MVPGLVRSAGSQPSEADRYSTNCHPPQASVILAMGTQVSGGREGRDDSTYLCLEHPPRGLVLFSGCIHFLFIYWNVLSPVLDSGT